MYVLEYVLPEPSDGRTSTCTDLLHAYKHICDAEAQNEDPVFMFEDSVELLNTAESPFREALQVVRRPGVDAVALGCFPGVGWRDRMEDDQSLQLEWHRVMLGGSTHAMLYSAEGRKKLSRLTLPCFMRCFMPFMPHDAWLYQLYQKLVVYIRPAPRWLDGYGSILRRRVVDTLKRNSWPSF